MEKQSIEQSTDSNKAKDVPATSDSTQSFSDDATEPEKITEHTTTRQSTKYRRPIFKIAAVILLLAIVAGSWLAYKEHLASKVVSTVSEDHKSAPDVMKQAAVQDTFYQTPKKLGNLNFFADPSAFGTSCTGTQTTNCPPTVIADDISYYQIGTTAVNQPVIEVFYRFTSQPGSIEYVALGLGNNQYSILMNLFLPPTDSNYSSFLTTLEKSLASNVKVDTKTTLSSLIFPKQATIDGETVTLQADEPSVAGYFINGLSGIRGWYYGGNVAATAMKKIGQVGGVSYYEVIVDNSNPDYAIKEIYGVVGGVYAARYVAQEPMASSTAPSISWATGSTVSTPTYISADQGCGSPNGFVVAKNILPSQLVVAGQGPEQITVYELPTTSTLFNDYYTDYSGGSGLSDRSLENLTATQFQNVHAVIIAKNALGDYVAYQRSDMFTGGQCGKPVIYLYPQKATSVDVSVGAQITASNPLYTAKGWQNVLAQPSGQLTYQGQSYSSLYWEGTGIGSYPLIDSGTIVPRREVVSTIKLQLKEQGLNAHEINDFLIYWQPKLPTTPYTRLSWLDTAQMNELAPLQITPARNGFTAVEWGGLLRGQ